jgi:hypothetical protein
MKHILISTFLLITAVLHAEAAVPDGFVLQMLEPTGGKIVCPKDWFYAERHGGPSYTWIISKEDVEKGPYDTGVRIQTIVGVEKGTGKTPKQFVMDFIEKKRKEAKQIFDECEPEDQGLFTRVCLQTEEGPYRILYSAFWANGSDIVVVSTAGTKTEEWGKYSEIFDQMSNFELIDMKRFEKE